MNDRLSLLRWLIYTDDIHDYYLFQLVNRATATGENIDFRFSRAQSPKGYECTMTHIEQPFYVDSVQDIPHELMAKLRQRFPDNPQYRGPFELIG
jgi:hypothetical protein